MPVPPTVSAEGDAAGTGPADPGAAASPNWRIEERDNVRLSVQDHGVGIPARDLDRIFERFYRVDHGRSRDTGGTGLGLSIVRHVANNHQGWVDVESREGEGSTFTLVLPIQAERWREQGRLGYGALVPAPQATRRPAGRRRARAPSRSCWPRTRSPSSRRWSSA